jgi:hypothetical protein
VVSAAQVEQRVRLLPAVRSCSIDDSRVTVLVDDATDRRNVAAGVAYILADLGMERMVHVLGGATVHATDKLPEPSRHRLWLLLVVGVVALGCVALGIVLMFTQDGDGSDARNTRVPVTTTLVTPSPAVPPPTFPPDWRLNPGQ